MLVPTGVQHAMHNEPSQLFAHTHTVFGGLFTCHVGADVDVTNNDTRRILPKCERNNVSGPAVSEMLPVERCDFTRRDQRNRQHGVADFLRGKHGTCKIDEPRCSYWRTSTCTRRDSYCTRGGANWRWCNDPGGSLPSQSIVRRRLHRRCTRE